jgi:hypothetical protein
VDAPTQLVDRVMLIETDLGMALVKVRVSEIENESGGGEGAVLCGVSAHDVRL